MAYTVDRNSQSQSEFGLMMPRLKSFAIALTGSDVDALSLLRETRAHALPRIDKERGHAPVVLWSLAQMRKVWTKRFAAKSKTSQKADPRLFQPASRVEDGGVSARLAMQLASLTPAQRGILHLVYGERLSYDEVGEVFETPVCEIIQVLVSAHKSMDNQGAPRQAAASDKQPRQPAYSETDLQAGRAA